jgi:hypothetical protein
MRHRFCAVTRKNEEFRLDGVCKNEGASSAKTAECELFMTFIFTSLSGFSKAQTQKTAVLMWQHEQWLLKPHKNALGASSALSMSPAF